ncbi:MAG: hypothetical protein IPP47_09870 [Bryobacterales bacterium]|nr:hypothetical protein [Bryobacterales bacterium]
MENTLAATAAAWGMDVLSEANPADGLRTFASDSKVPSRFNVMEYRGATVIVDYGHPHALRALIDAPQAFPQTRRVASLLLLRGPARRRYRSHGLVVRGRH